MDKDLLIEPISKGNFYDFLLLIDKLAEYEKLIPPNRQARKRLREDGLSKNTKYEAYVGKIRGTYVGYFIFFMTYSSLLAKPTLYLEDIFVLEEYRKIGIGQNFLNFIVSIAKERGCGRVEWHVLRWNKPGIAFYEKNNAQHLSDWLFYRLTSDQFDAFLK